MEINKLIRAHRKEHGGPRPGRAFVVYQDVGGQWRWRLQSVSNGQTVGGSQEDFASRHHAKRAARREASFYSEGKAIVILLAPSTSPA